MVIAGIVLAGVMVLTGGPFIAHLDHFNGQRNIILVPGLKSDIFINTNLKMGGFPFVGGYMRDVPPYGVRIQVWDKSKKFIRLNIDSMVLKYKGGKTERIDMAWQKEFEPYLDMMMVSETLEGIVKEHEDLEVRLSGFLTTSKGEECAFDVKEAFEAETNVVVIPYWMKMLHYHP